MGRFLPVGPVCRIAHYELHVRTENGVSVDTLELTRGCPQCGCLHDKDCNPSQPSYWPTCKLANCDKGQEWHMAHSLLLWRNNLSNWV